MSVGFEPTGVDVVAGRSGIGMRESFFPRWHFRSFKGYVTRDAARAFTRNPT